MQTVTVMTGCVQEVTVCPATGVEGDADVEASKSRLKRRELPKGLKGKEGFSQSNKGKSEGVSPIL